MLRTLLIVSLILVFSQGLTFPNEDDLICNGCQFVVNLVGPPLKTIERVTKTDLSNFADKVCARAPDLEVFITLCSKVKDDLIDIAVQLIEAVERQLNGNVTCKALRLCH